MTIAGDGNSPYCDSSGCAFDLNSDFHTTIPSGIPLDWTFSFWVVFDGNTQSLVNIIVNLRVNLERDFRYSLY